MVVTTAVEVGKKLVGEGAGVMIGFTSPAMGVEAELELELVDLVRDPEDELRGLC